MLMLFVAITHCHLVTVCGHCIFEDKNRTKRVQQQIPHLSVNSWQNPLFNQSDKELSDQCQLYCCPPLIDCSAAIIDDEFPVCSLNTSTMCVPNLTWTKCLIGFQSSLLNVACKLFSCQFGCHTQQNNLAFKSMSADLFCDQRHVC